MPLVRRWALTLVILAGGCATPPDPDSECEGDSCDQGGALTCKVSNRSGGGAGGIGRAVDTLADPVAQRLLRADSCPTTMAAVNALIDDCTSGTARVDEVGNAGGARTGDRTLTMGACEEQDIFTSTLGDVPDGPTPEDGELIGFDAGSGAFNFYALEGGKWSFFGSSIDLLAGAGPGGERRCAGCHPGGSPIMKELRSPWVHWMGGPGSRLLMATEQSIRGATDKWIDTRVRHTLDTATLREALRPLFCTVEINLGAMRSETDFLPANLFAVSPFVAMEEGDQIDRLTAASTDYEALIAANNQRMETAPGQTVTGEGGEVIRDARAPLIYPERSDVDTEYVLGLIEAGVITQRFADDVRMVDFTRPVLSDRRCALLELVPETPAKGATAESVAAAVTAALAGRPSPAPWERELLTALQDVASDADHAAAQKARVDAFLGRCAALPDATAEALRIGSQLRELARPLPVIELRAQLPVDDLAISPGARVDEASCRLR